MKRTLTRGAWIAGWCVLASVGRAGAQEAPPAEEKSSTATKETVRETSTEEKALPGPKYLNLRYDEDFSYLAGEPGTYQEDFFDPIKCIRLGDDLRLTIGGEFRLRMESETNKGFGAGSPTQDNFQLYRMYTHFDLKYRDTARVFLQLGSALVGDRERASRAIDENRFTLQQAFVDVKPLGDGTKLTVRVGRQDLQYGKQRFVSPLDWANTRRRFDAVKVFWRDKEWSLDVFYAKPVVVRPEHRDRWNEEYDFYGAYVTYKGIPRHALDFFFFAQDRTDDRTNPNGNSGDMSRYTLGSVFSGKTGDFDYTAFLAGQWGRWAGDTIQAWAWGVDGGYTFTKCPWKPRFGAGFDWASGDEHPDDGKVGTFDQLFPLGHAYLGYLDLVGRQNITAANVNLTFWPVAKKVKTRLGYHAFWLNARRDALYNVGGAPGRRDSFGDSGTEVGHELDLTVVWKIDRHQSMLFGYSHFWDADFITQTGTSEDPDLFYVQYAFKF
ncbi:MAG: alginate export family protein [bacterium]|nr:alginate export family protein [bacterium]